MPRSSAEKARSASRPWTRSVHSSAKPPRAVEDAPDWHDDAQDNQPDGNLGEEDGNGRREPLSSEPLCSRGRIGFGRAHQAAHGIIARDRHSASGCLPGNGDRTECPPSGSKAAKRKQAERRATDTDRADCQAANRNRRDRDASYREDRTDRNITDSNPPTGRTLAKGDITRPSRRVRREAVSGWSGGTGLRPGNSSPPRNRPYVTEQPVIPGCAWLRARPSRP